MMRPSTGRVIDLRPGPDRGQYASLFLNGSVMERYYARLAIPADVHCAAQLSER
jgi:hypothetical protein